MDCINFPSTEAVKKQWMRSWKWICSLSSHHFQRSSLLGSKQLWVPNCELLSHCITNFRDLRHENAPMSLERTVLSEQFGKQSSFFGLGNLFPARKSFSWLSQWSEISRWVRFLATFIRYVTRFLCSWINLKSDTNLPFSLPAKSFGSVNFSIVPRSARFSPKYFNL